MKNYIGNNNEINKKKYKKSLPPKLNPDAGNVEYNVNIFNKVNSGEANLSSAAGMNGMAENYDRESLITRIIEFGKHYNFEKYTDAQLNAMLNRLVDASNYKKRVLPKHQDRMEIKSERHTMNDDPSYNFDDPDREGEYRVESLREALNRLDHSCIDNDKQFHDLRSLYENIQHQLTPQEKQELKKLVDTTNDPDAVKAYLDSKDPNKKNEELEEEHISEEDAIKEALEKATDESSASLIAFIESNHPEIVPVSMDSYLEWYNKIDDKIKPLLESNDNLTYDELRKLAQEHYKEGGADIIDFWDENSLQEYEKEFGPLTKKQALRLMKVMGNVSADEEEAGRYFAKQTFDEGLNRKELETFSRAIFNAGDKEEAQKIIDEIYQYDKDLSLQLKDMWDDSASDAYNTDKLSGYLLRYNESLEEGVLDDLRARRVEKKDVPADKHINYDMKFRYKERNDRKEALQEANSVTFNLESIPTDALRDCSNINQVTFEGKPTIVGKRAFMNCTGLEEMTLPESIHTIEDEAFRGCSNLKKLTIPNTKVDIGKNVFEGCTKLVKNKNEELVQEDTVKQGKKWVNKGDSGKTHGKFNTKKEADAQRRAMFANGYKAESLKESEEYTRLISEKAGPALQKLLDTDEPDMTYDDLRNVVEEFRIDLEKFPKNDLDIKYDCDKDRFYKKYRAFADICKRKKKELHPTGYGKMDFVDVKKKELCNLVDNRFPYGWKVYNGAADRQAVTEDVDSTLAARERKDRIEYLKNQIKEATSDWETSLGYKGSIDVLNQNDKKIRYLISPYIRHDNGESLDVIEKTFKEVVRKVNKYFGLEGQDKFRMKSNPLYITIICP